MNSGIISLEIFSYKTKDYKNMHTIFTGKLLPRFPLAAISIATHWKIKTQLRDKSGDDIKSVFTLTLCSSMLYLAKANENP